MNMTGDIDVKKVDKSLLVKGQYLRLRFVENKDGRDKYGNDGFIAQGVTREHYQAGKKGPILGNWKDWDRDDAPAAKKQESHVEYVDEDDNDDIPF